MRVSNRIISKVKSHTDTPQERALKKCRNAVGPSIIADTVAPCSKYSFKHLQAMMFELCSRHTCRETCIQVYVYIYVYIQGYIYIHTCIYIYIHIEIYTCIYIYIYIWYPPMNPRLVMVIWSSPTETVLLALLAGFRIKG